MIYPFGASYYIADHTEHTLFNTQAGPIDWSDPEWVQRYHRGVMQSLIDWLNDYRVAPGDCAAAWTVHQRQETEAALG
jgi:hypothetical protein